MSSIRRDVTTWHIYTCIRVSNPSSLSIIYALTMFPVTTIGFNQTSYSVFENEETVTVVIVVLEGQLRRLVPLNIFTVPQTAQGGGCSTCIYIVSVLVGGDTYNIQYMYPYMVVQVMVWFRQRVTHDFASILDSIAKKTFCSYYFWHGASLHHRSFS